MYQRLALLPSARWIFVIDWGDVRVTALGRVREILRFGVAITAEPFTTLWFESVAMMVSVPSTAWSLMASTVKAKAPVPVPLRAASKVRVSTPSKVTPAVAPAAVTRAATKSS